MKSFLKTEKEKDLFSEKKRDKEGSSQKADFQNSLGRELSLSAHAVFSSEKLQIKVSEA